MTFCTNLGLEQAIPFLRKLSIIGLMLIGGSCGLPTLESPVCIDARPSVREFYSFHFGNDMAVTPEGLKSRERFLSQNMIESSANAAEGTDPFTTGTTDIPRAFRVGSCVEGAAGSAVFQVLLLWRDEESTDQRTVVVETVKQNGRWLIDSVKN